MLHAKVYRLTYWTETRNEPDASRKAISVGIGKAVVSNRTYEKDYNLSFKHIYRWKVKSFDIYKWYNTKQRKTVTQIKFVSY